MDPIKLDCEIEPTNYTAVHASDSGGIFVKSPGCDHSREQAEDLRDWLDEYLSQPTQQEIEMAEMLREAWFGESILPLNEWSYSEKNNWLNVARAAMERGAK